MVEFFVRLPVVYLVLLLATRIMGKREIGQLSSIDFVVAIVVAELATMPITDIKLPLMQSLIPILLLTLLQIITSMVCLKSDKFRQFLYGKPSILISNGQMQVREMRKARYNIDDLLTQLRQRDVFDIADVDHAVLETSGDLTVVLRPAKRGVTLEDIKDDIPDNEAMPLSLIVDGDVNRIGLNEAGLDENWLKDRLKEQGVKDFSEVFFASLSANGSIYLMKKSADQRPQRNIN